MIEEINSSQYVQHYFEKVYKELDYSPETFLRAALEYVHREAGLLSQPGALESLRRLAEHVAEAEGVTISVPETARPHAPEPPSVTTASVEPASGGAGARQPTPSAAGTPATPMASVDMAEGSAADAVEEDDEDIEVDGGSGLKPNEGNGADLATYSWTQTLQEVVLTIPVPKGTRGRDCDVAIARTTLRAGLKGATPILNGELFAAVTPDACFWNLLDGSTLEITLQKVDAMQWWKAVVLGEPEIDTQKVEPEASKLSDLDPDMRATVEKMMFDQRQKALGLPTSEDTKKEDIMKKFMAAHPEMDFSNAKFM